MPTCSQLTTNTATPLTTNDAPTHGNRRAIQISPGFTCTGGAISSLTLQMKQAGSTLSGTVYFQVWNSSNVLQYTLGSFPASELTTSLTDKTLSVVTATYTLQNGDYIGVYYDSGSGSSYIEISVATTTSDSNAILNRYPSNTSWNSVSGATMYYTVVTDPIPDAPTTRLPPPPIVLSGL